MIDFLSMNNRQRPRQTSTESVNAKDRGTCVSQLSLNLVVGI